MNKKLFLSMCVAPVAAMAFQVGAWVGGPGQYPQPTQQNVQAFQDLQGTHLDLISYFALFDINDWNATEEYANVAKENGSTLVVTWMANGYGAQDLVDGRADEYIRDYAKGVKNYGEEIWLRPLHEANGDWYDWGVGKEGAGNTDANVAEAFRHIVKIFREENVETQERVPRLPATTPATNTSTTSPSTATTGANARAGPAGRLSRRYSRRPTTLSRISTSHSSSPKFRAPNSAGTRPNGLPTCSSILPRTSPAFSR